MEEGLHAGAQGLVVAVDLGPDGGLGAWSGAVHAGEDGADDLVPEGEQSGDGADGSGFNRMNAPCDAKVIGDFTGLTPPGVFTGF